MTKGEGAFANLALQDDKTVIYEYGSFNLSDPAHRNESRLADGIITIQRRCFVEPEIHEKIKRMPSGRKRLVTKRVPVHVDYPRMIREGQIVIENCSNCWSMTKDGSDLDFMALHLLRCILYNYQEHGVIPERIVFYD